MPLKPEIEKPESERKRVGFALVGIGQLTAEQLIPAARTSEHAHIAALVTSEEDKGEAFARAFDRIGGGGNTSPTAADPTAAVRREIERWRNHFPDLDAAAGPTPAEVREARKQIARIERRLARLSEQTQRLHTDMAEQAGDHVALTELTGKLRTLETEQSELEEEWLEYAEVAG